MKLAMIALSALSPQGDKPFTCLKSDQPRVCAEGDNCPIIRTDAPFPEECVGGMAPKEKVVARTTVAPDGLVISAQVVESSNACFNEAAVKTICRWRYSVLTETAESQRNREFLETITFQLEDEDGNE